MEGTPTDMGSEDGGTPVEGEEAFRERVRTVMDSIPPEEQAAANQAASDELERKVRISQAWKALINGRSDTSTPSSL